MLTVDKNKPSVSIIYWKSTANVLCLCSVSVWGPSSGVCGYLWFLLWWRWDWHCKIISSDSFFNGCENVLSGTGRLSCGSIYIHFLSCSLLNGYFLHDLKRLDERFFFTQWEDHVLKLQDYWDYLLFSTYIYGSIS